MNPETTATKFWCDDFDADLYKVVPGAKAILTPVANVKLFTRGHITNGRLNHPTVWNHEMGYIAFFSFGGEPRPSETFHSFDPIIECTFAEAVRDAFVHGITMVLEKKVIFHAGALARDYSALLYNHRGWRKDGSGDGDVSLAIARSTIALRRAVAEFSLLCAKRGIEFGDIEEA